jgi:hypothetical protein
MPSKKNAKQEFPSLVSIDKRSRHSIVAKYKALSPAIQHVAMLIAEYMNQTSEQELQAVFDIDDTLIFDDDRATPNIQVKHLLEVARAHGCKIHLVTARERSPEVVRWTREELKRHNIVYDSLSLAPPSVRTSMADVAIWKYQERAKRKPVVLSVGDQWGDSLLLLQENDIDVLDSMHDAKSTPWIIVRPNDDVTVYGVKLMAETSL